MFLKNLTLLSSVLATVPTLTSSLNISQSCDQYFDREERQKIDSKYASIYKQLYFLIDINFNNTIFYTKKNQTSVNEIGKYGDFVTAEQLGIDLNFNPQSFKTEKVEDFLGYKLTVDLNLIKLNLRIYKVDKEKGIVYTAKKIMYNDFCFYHKVALVIYGFKK